MDPQFHRIPIGDGPRTLAVITPPLPRKVEAAIGFVNMLRCPVMSTDGEPQKPKLSDSEGSAYESALAVIRLYFTGEMNFAEPQTVLEMATTKASE